MDRVLIKKYIGQSALLWVACGLALFAFAWVRVWVVSLLDMGQFQAVLDLFKGFERFAPIEFSALTTYSGRVGMTYDEPIVILCVVIWCVARGSDVVSGELGRGTLEMLLAQPITRSRLMLSHAVVGVGGLALLCLLVWAGIAAGVHFSTITETLPPSSLKIPIINVRIPLGDGEPVLETFPMADRVDPSLYAASTFHLFAFGFFILAMAVCFSSLDRYRWRTIGSVMAVYIVQFVVFGLGKAAESLDWLQSLSFFACYRPQKMTQLIGNEGPAAPWSLTATSADAMLPPLVYPLILIGLGVLLYLIALWRFESRDLPAPL